MFKKAILRTPCKNIVKGLSSANLGKPNYELVLKQHQEYHEALKKCGLEVTILETNENYPDSTFVEDTALLTPNVAIITNPGAPSRRGEIKEIAQLLTSFYPIVETIETPGTLEAGDVMMVGKHFYIGLSYRTNQEGANQLINILNRYGYTGSKVILGNILHLKSGLSYLENNNLLSIASFLNRLEFKKFNKILVEDDESYAANSLWINNKVLVPKGFPKTKKKIEEAGYTTIEVDVSEFRKLDGGLSCLSLRY
jgi:dimethylargininase